MAENGSLLRATAKWLHNQLLVWLVAWARAVRLTSKLAICLTTLAALAAVASYMAVAGLPPFGPNPRITFLLIIIDSVLLLVLGLVILLRVVEVWVERRRGLAGSRLHVRLVMLFGAVAIIPSIVMSILSAIFFNVEISGWFNEQIRTTVYNSRIVAEAYLREHQQVIRGDVLALSSDLQQNAGILFSFGIDKNVLDRALETEAMLRNLAEVIIFDDKGRILGRSLFSSTLEHEMPSPVQIEQARRGEIVIITNEPGDRVLALMQIGWTNMPAYLYVGRLIDAGVLTSVSEARKAAAAYRAVEKERGILQSKFALVFGIMALLLLFVAAWVGLAVATNLVRPISSLIVASERVRRGEVNVRVEGKFDPHDGLGSLRRAFNRMTHQISVQQHKLIETNQQLDQRRRFIEGVLAGVTAGVIGLDAEGRINLPNKSASFLLSIDLEQHLGEPLVKLVPEMATLLKAVLSHVEKPLEAEIKLIRDKRSRILLARVTADVVTLKDTGGIGEKCSDVRGLILTFDDITELVTAQRAAAWADVARRIAHEIKNPLTPIQLCAERLKRRYSKEILSDITTFELCTDTIIRQVGDIGRMVDEFSAFARMPTPVMKLECLNHLVRDVVFLMRDNSVAVNFVLRLPSDTLEMCCDARQIRQALINILQNAYQAIEDREQFTDKSNLLKGVITVRLFQEDDSIIIEIEDNGCGLPSIERERLTEPYVTTRAKGTGLGLAIVKKIMEDHMGFFTLGDVKGGGTKVQLIFERLRSRVAVADDVQVSSDGI